MLRLPGGYVLAGCHPDPDPRRTRTVRRRWLALPLSIVSLLAVPASAIATNHAVAYSVRPATYGVSTSYDVPIKMSDGVTLYANVYRPADQSGTPASGRFPVI